MPFLALAVWLRYQSSPPADVKKCEKKAKLKRTWTLFVSFANQCQVSLARLTNISDHRLAVDWPGATIVVNRHVHELAFGDLGGFAVAMILDPHLDHYTDG